MTANTLATSGIGCGPAEAAWSWGLSLTLTISGSFTGSGPRSPGRRRWHDPSRAIVFLIVRSILGCLRASETRADRRSPTGAPVAQMTLALPTMNSAVPARSPVSASMTWNNSAEIGRRRCSRRNGRARRSSARATGHRSAQALASSSTALAILSDGPLTNRFTSP